MALAGYMLVLAGVAVVKFRRGHHNGDPVEGNSKTHRLLRDNAALVLFLLPETAQRYSTTLVSSYLFSFC
jgi:hypothetical protein